MGLQNSGTGSEEVAMGKRLLRFLMVLMPSVFATQPALSQTGVPVDVLPLAIGNEWVYRYQRVDSLP